MKYASIPGERDESDYSVSFLVVREYEQEICEQFIDPRLLDIITRHRECVRNGARVAGNACMRVCACVPDIPEATRSAVTPA